MDAVDASDYNLLKEAILNAYHVTPEQYRDAPMQQLSMWLFKNFGEATEINE